MAITRIVADLQTSDPKGLSTFYAKVFDLKPVMDQGWIVTLANPNAVKQLIQLSFASEGGSGTPVPTLSIEVDNLDDVLNRIRALGMEPEYGPVDEPWGVRRFFMRDPAGTLINVLTHVNAENQ